MESKTFYRVTSDEGKLRLLAFYYLSWHGRTTRVDYSFAIENAHAPRLRGWNSMANHFESIEAAQSMIEAHRAFWDSREDLERDGTPQGPLSIEPVEFFKSYKNVRFDNSYQAHDASAVIDFDFEWVADATKAKSKRSLLIQKLSKTVDEIKSCEYQLRLAKNQEAILSKELVEALK